MLDQFIGQTLADKYRIDSVLRDGGGGLGKFYLGTHVSMEKPVTVKILAPALAVDENIVKNFSSEARTVSRIAHQNILNVTDFGSDKTTGATYIVFEGADGDSLKNAIAREGTLEFERAARIARQIAAALAAAHSNRVVHRQLNSANILLTRTANDAEIVKVMDFGAAEIEEENESESAPTIKKLEYLSPEQNSSVAEADERSDIYSLGVIFYEMLAGEVPFTADNSMDLLLKQANNPPAPLSAFRKDLPPAVEPVILRALAKNPDMRYQTAAEFIRELNTVSGDLGEPETAIHSAAALQTDEAVKNNLWKTAFVVLAGISLLAISLIYATQSKQTDPATVLQTDANGQPVQPLNPATGMNEQGAANMITYSPEQMMLGANSNMLLTRPDAMPPTGDGFGDGYNPWDRGVPPPGAPPLMPGGQMIDPNNPNSIFMQDGIIYERVPVPVNANVAVPTANANVRPTANANVNARPANVAPSNTAAPPTNAALTTKPQPSPVKTPAAPAPKPSPAPPTRTPPAAGDRSAQSGKEQDSL